MVKIILPHEWQPMQHQIPLYDQFGHGKKFQRGSVIWHRRAGKDSTGLNITARDMAKRRGTYWHLFPEQAQARKAIWNGIDKNGRRILDQVFPGFSRCSARRRPAGICKRVSNQEMLIETIFGSIWQMAGSDNYDSLVGSNPIAVVFTEWALSNPAAWDYIRPILLENGGWALFITTPRGQNHAYTTHSMAQTNPNWFDQVLPWHETGILTAEDIQSERDEGMSDSKIDQEYGCSFEAETDEQFMSSEDVALCRKLAAYATVDDPLILGVDVARFGDDKSVLFPRRGRDARTLPVQTFSKISTMQLVGKITAWIDEHHPDAVYIDVTGVGGGVVDRLEQLGYDVLGVNFGWKPDYALDGARKTANKRTEMYENMRVHMSTGVSIPDDDRLAFELLASNYSYDKDNLIQLEKKDDMKKRGLQSPDKADALALTYAYPTVARSVEIEEEEKEAEDFDPIWGD